MNTLNRCTICHPHPAGKGSAVRFELYPARGAVAGHIMVEIAPQKSAASAAGEVPVFATFDWSRALRVKLCASDLAQVVMVFRGMQESIADGKGLFHRTQTANTVFKFAHMIEPRPGYLLEVSSKPHDGELATVHFIFRPEEAVWLSLAIEASMGVIVFGVPTADGDETGEEVTK